MQRLRNPQPLNQLVNMFNNRFAVFALVFGMCVTFIGCKNQKPSPIGSNTIEPKLIANDNFINIEGDTTINYSLHVLIGSDISFEKKVKANQKISYISLLKENKDFFNDIALLLAKNTGDLTMKLSLSEECDTTVAFHLDIKDTNQYVAQVISGTCAPTTGTFDPSNVESDIIKWLYRKHESNLGDSIINNMRLYLKELNRSNYKEYSTSHKIPVVNSLRGIEYKITSDLKADHYYLFACNNEKDVEDFVEEMVSVKFESSTNSLNQSMPCFRSSSTSGCACILLVGINNDWSFHFVPVGLICIDNISPMIGGVGGRSIINESSQFTFENKQIKVFAKSTIPVTSGTVGVGFGKFEGYGYMLNVPFTFTFSGDVKTIIVHQTKSQTEVIDLSDKTSPYHITIRVGLDTGDNYIPIDAIDACGNKATYDLRISTERIKDNPVIENNIYN